MKIDHFERDVHEVPGHLDMLAERIERKDPWTGIVSRAPLLSGMGSSGYAARTASGWLQSAGVGAVPELASSDPGWPGGAGTTAVLISASGRSAETLDRSARLGDGTQRIALVNDIDSALAADADLIVDMAAGREVGEVACRTYRHTIALLLAMGLERDEVALAAREAAQITRCLLDQPDWLAALDSALDGSAASFWLAPESRIGSALQSALMIREVPRRLAVACETGEWSHVDVYLSLTMDYRCVIFTGSRWDEQAADWLVKRGSTVVSVGDALGIPDEVHLPLPGTPIVRMLAEPILAELLALAWWRRDPVEVP